MSVGDTIQALRKQRGLTQEQLARRIYVTRQAVSRWETGESTPSIDMRKLLATALGVSAAELFEIPSEPSCQCCGTPFSVANMEPGTNADGTSNAQFCLWCYREGKFTTQSLDETIELNAPYLAQATGCSIDEAVSFLGAFLPTLKHWRDVANANKAANLKRSVFYICPTCENIIWSAGEMEISCCGHALDPLVSVPNDGMLEASIEKDAGIVRVHISHPMTKERHVLFIAAIGDDLARIKRLYPEQEAYVEFSLQGPYKLYAYANDCGLVEL